MKPSISVITIGVDDLDKSVVFYRDGLGLKTDGIVDKEFEFGAVAFFKLQSDLQLALWPRKSISHDTGIDEQPKSSTEFTSRHNVNSIIEVDDIMPKAEDAGAIIVKQARETFWGGYAGYFQDIDGHLWEAVFNARLVVEE